MSARMDVDQPAPLPQIGVVVNQKGLIVSANSAWVEQAHRNNFLYPGAGVGLNYLAHCTGEAAPLAQQLRRLFTREIDVVTHVYYCETQGKYYWNQLTALPVRTGRQPLFAIYHFDLSHALPFQLNALRTSFVQVTTAPAISIHTRPAAELLDPASLENAANIIRRLTPRQIEVLKWISLGLSNEDISERMSCAENTVKRHVSALLAQLNVRRRGELAALMSALGNPSWKQ